MNDQSAKNTGNGAMSLPKHPAWKRGLDIGCILLTLPATGPLLVLISVAIKLVSKGPIFFRQPRVGYHGEEFTCFKFRSMRIDADRQVHETYFKELMQSSKPMTKLDNYGDPRLISLGALLRSSGLDELPQLFNVFRGEMSLVGPRPCTPNEYADYLPWHKERFNALPGLTGLWQVSGKNDTTFDEMIQLDIQYAQRRSLWLDLKIMLKTLPVLIREVIDMAKQRRKSPKKTENEDRASVHLTFYRVNGNGSHRNGDHGPTETPRTKNGAANLAGQARRSNRSKHNQKNQKNQKQFNRTGPSS